MYLQIVYIFEDLVLPPFKSSHITRSFIVMEIRKHRFFIRDGELSGLLARLTCPNHLNRFFLMMFSIGGCPVTFSNRSLGILSAMFTPMIVL